MHDNALSLDGIVHFQRVTDGVDATTADELDRAEFLGWVEVQLLVVWLLVVVVVMVGGG